VAKTLIAEVKALTPDDDAWVAKMKVLIESVEHHAGEEEAEMFPETRKVFDENELEDLGAKLEALKARLGAPTAANKETPDDPTAQGTRLRTRDPRPVVDEPRGTSSDGFSGLSAWHSAEGI